MIKFLILLGLVVWLGMRFRVFLSKFWLAFIEPTLDRVGEKASQVVSEGSSSGFKPAETELSKSQAEDLRQ